ncbi:hypothetical protein Tco_0072193 [Tanacetum coccineum]
MKDNFEMSMIGEMKFFLGLQAHQSPRGIFLCESQYTLNLLKKHGMEKCDTICTPMAKTKLDADLQSTQFDQTKYHSMIGGFMYLTASRPDIAFAKFVCARYQAHPTEKHLKEVKRIFRYLRQTINMGLWYSKDSGFELIAYSDADLAGCNDDCKSTSGGIQLLGDKLVIIWMRTQLLDYGFGYNKIPIYCDSQSAIAISCNPIQHSRTEHINIRYHFIKEHVEKGTIELYFVGTEYQLAGLFTKALPKERFEYLVHRIVFHMAQQVIPAAQLVPRFHTIGICNNYTVLQSIPCSLECKIVGQILLDHPLSYALTATADVPVMYLQQFWRMVSKVPVESPKNLFVTPVNIETIEVFMNKVGYQEIPKRIEEDYHSIKDENPLVSVYTTRDVRVRGMLIPDAFLTEEIRATDDFKEYETVFIKVDVPKNQPQPVVSTQGKHRSTPRAHRTPTLTASPQGKNRKQIVEANKDDDDSENRLEPESHKDNLEHVDDNDDKDEEKVDEEEGCEMGTLETKTEETQPTIPTPPRSHRTILSSEKNLTQELTETVPLLTPTTSNTPRSKRRISSKYNHLPGALRRMCRRQGYMIQNMKRKCVTTKQFWKTHKQVNQVLHLGVSLLAEKAIKELIETNLKPCIAATIIEDRDAFHSEVPDLVSQEFNAQAPKII